jgi:hypothetical protein
LIPPDHNGGFVANMEKVLDVYKLPFDPDHPVVCMDESAEAIERRDKGADSSGKRTTREI